jgi:hypothetical protein
MTPEEQYEKSVEVDESWRASSAYRRHRGRDRRDGCMDSCVAGYPRLDRPMTRLGLGEKSKV